jgi:glycosyltransferase involved in cell wall biosynthesis
MRAHRRLSERVALRSRRDIGAQTTNRVRERQWFSVRHGTFHTNLMAAEKLRITFVLPGGGATPIGGYKVVYEYAGHLSQRGHQVTVVHPQLLFREVSGVKRGRSLLAYARHKITGSYRPDSWFQVDPRIRMVWVWSLDERYIPDADVIVATCWETAEAVAGYSGRKGRAYNLIQHWETWSGPEERVRATWKMPLRKIVIASWLKQIAEELGEPAVLIPNGLDFSRFGLDVPPQNRDRHRLMMLYHTYEWKGSADGMEALSIVKGEIPDLQVTLFGTPEAPRELPDWISYHHKPEQRKLRELYNQASIFVAPSWTEGWPLPPAEAMMCGAALAATDIGGHKEYAIHGRTALLSPARNPAALAENLSLLIRDDDLRVRVASQGHDFVQQFTWSRAVESLEAALRQT